MPDTNQLGGRPSKLSREMVESASLYLIDCEKAVIVVRSGISKGGGEWSQTSPRLPNHARLAFVLGVDKSTLYEWCKPHPNDTSDVTTLREQFSYCITRIKQLQEAMLNENGASGVFNPAVTNRILAAQHGYSDKTEVDQKGELTINIVSQGKDDPITKG